MKIKNIHLSLIAFAIFNLQLLIYNAKAQVCFAPSTSLILTDRPYSIINADFNGDNNADLAVTIGDVNIVSVFLGNGTGSFGSVTNFTVGDVPASIISADFNNDSKADLVVANINSNSISVMLGDGTGNFSAPSNLTIGNYPLYSVISADFNNDGKADLAMLDRVLYNVSVVLGDGMGGFGSATNFTVGADPYSVISVDLNVDGKTDLAVANRNDNNVSILLGDGLGSFATVNSFPVGNNPSSVIIGDFNGDSKIDLATANQNSNNVSVLLGNGTGSFGVATNFVVGNSPTSGISGDFNGDGKADLVVANVLSNNVSVLLGNGLGNFDSATSFIAGTNPASVISNDFNNDGKADLAVANLNSNNVSILLNTPQPTVTANANATLVCAGTSVTLTGSGATSYTWTGGVTDGVAFIPSSTITYTVIGTTASGCYNSAIKTIIVNPLPTATFTTQNESSSLYCDGTIKAYLAGGTGTIQHQWLDSIQTVLSITDSAGSLCPGIYTLHLTDANNCTNTYTQTIQAGPIPPTPPICLVTVDSTLTHNLLVWEKTNINMTPIDSFIVYREITTNNYQRIASVVHDSLSIFTDLASNPANTGYRYKLKSKNARGVLSLFSNYHNTIYLTNTGGNFSWTPYQIENNTTPVSTYNVYRDDNSTGNFILIGFTTGNQLGYTDIQYSSIPNASYYVEAVMAGGVCSPTRADYATSRSNVKYIGSNGIHQLNNNSPIKIYPNPSTNVLNITGFNEKTTIRLYDVVGKLVIEKEVESNTTINTNLLTEGVYTLLTENKMGKTFNKVVVTR